eukprot:TRINITY_DN3440_c0_g1_i2.p1 TRINITY_DN3440_c0_g1~~TRINITY_DN3440_c0_g1_i2.p1  ORF type:complete len:2802 (+),score=778.93 TRINITY_DN3440_c0_g1_i2:77-8482(+)
MEQERLRREEQQREDAALRQQLEAECAELRERSVQAEAKLRAAEVSRDEAQGRLDRAGAEVDQLRGQLRQESAQCEKTVLEREQAVRKAEEEAEQRRKAEERAAEAELGQRLAERERDEALRQAAESAELRRRTDAEMADANVQAQRLRDDEIEHRRKLEAERRDAEERALEATLARRRVEAERDEALRQAQEAGEQRQKMEKELAEAHLKVQEEASLRKRQEEEKKELERQVMQEGELRVKLEAMQMEVTQQLHDEAHLRQRAAAQQAEAETEVQRLGDLLKEATTARSEAEKLLAEAEVRCRKATEESSAAQQRARAAEEMQRRAEAEREESFRQAQVALGDANSQASQAKEAERCAQAEMELRKKTEAERREFQERAREAELARRRAEDERDEAQRLTREAQTLQLRAEDAQQSLARQAAEEGELRKKAEAEQQELSKQLLKETESRLKAEAMQLTFQQRVQDEAHMRQLAVSQQEECDRRAQEEHRLRNVAEKDREEVKRKLDAAEQRCAEQLRAIEASKGEIDQLRKQHEDVDAAQKDMAKRLQEAVLHAAAAEDQLARCKTAAEAEKAEADRALQDLRREVKLQLHEAEDRNAALRRDLDAAEQRCVLNKNVTEAHDLAMEQLRKQLNESNGVQETLIAAKIDLEDLKRQLASSHVELGQAQQRCAAADEKLRYHEEHHDHELKALKDQLEMSKQTLLMSQAEREQMAARLAAHEATARRREAEMAELSAELQSKKRQLENAEALGSADQQQMLSALQRLTDELEEAKKKLAAAEQRVLTDAEKHKSELDALQQRNSESSHELKALKDQLERSQAEREQMVARLAAQEETARRREADMAELSAALQSKKRQLENAEAVGSGDQQQMPSALQRLADELEEAKKKLAAAEQRVLTDAEKHKSELDALQQRNSESSHELKALKDQLERSQAEREQMVARLAAQEETARRREADMAELSAALQSKKRQLENAEALGSADQQQMLSALQRLTDELEEAKKKLAAAEQRVLTDAEKHKSELDALQQRNSESSLELASQAQLIEEMERQLEAAKDQFALTEKTLKLDLENASSQNGEAAATASHAHRMQLDELKRKLEDAERQCATAAEKHQSELEESRERFASMEKRLKQELEDARAKQGEGTELSEAQRLQLEELRRQLEEAERQSAALIEKHQSELVEARKQQNSSEALNKQLEAVTQELSDLKGRLSVAHAQLDAAEQRSSAMSRAMEEHEQRHQAELAALQGQLQSSREALALSKADRESAEKRRKHSETRQAEVEELAVQLQRTRKSLREDSEALAALASAAGEGTGNPASDAGASRRPSVDLEAHLREALRAAEAAEAALTASRAEVTELQRAATEAERRCARAEEELQVAGDRCAAAAKAAEERCTEQAAEVAKLNVELERSHQALDGMLQENAQLELAEAARVAREQLRLSEARARDLEKEKEKAERERDEALRQKAEAAAEAVVELERLRGQLETAERAAAEAGRAHEELESLRAQLDRAQKEASTDAELRLAESEKRVRDYADQLREASQQRSLLQAELEKLQQQCLELGPTKEALTATRQELASLSAKCEELGANKDALTSAMQELADLKGRLALASQELDVAEQNNAEVRRAMEEHEQHHKEELGTLKDRLIVSRQALLESQREWEQHTAKHAAGMKKNRRRSIDIGELGARIERKRLSLGDITLGAESFQEALQTKTLAESVLATSQEDAQAILKCSKKAQERCEAVQMQLALAEQGCSNSVQASTEWTKRQTSKVDAVQEDLARSHSALGRQTSHASDVNPAERRRYSNASEESATITEKALRQNEKLQLQLQECNAELQRLGTECNELRSMKDMFVSASQELEDLKSRLVGAHSQLDVAEKRSTALSAAMQDREQQFNVELEYLRDQLAQSRSALSDSQAELERRKAQQMSDEEQGQQQKSTMEELNARLKRSRLSLQNVQLGKDVEAPLQEALQASAMAEAALVKSQKEASEMKRRLDEALLELEKYKSNAHKSEALTGELKSTRDALQAATQEIADLKSQLAGAHAQLDTAEKHSTALSTAMQEREQQLNVELESLTDELKQSRSAKDERSEGCSALASADVERLTLELLRSQEALEACRSRCAYLEQMAAGQVASDDAVRKPGGVDPRSSVGRAEQPAECFGDAGDAIAKRLEELAKKLVELGAGLREEDASRSAEGAGNAAGRLAQSLSLSRTLTQSLDDVSSTAQSLGQNLEALTSRLGFGESSELIAGGTGGAGEQSSEGSLATNLRAVRQLGGKIAALRVQYEEQGLLLEACQFDVEAARQGAQVAVAALQAGCGTAGRLGDDLREIARLLRSAPGQPVQALLPRASADAAGQSELVQAAARASSQASSSDSGSDSSSDSDVDISQLHPVDPRLQDAEDQFSRTFEALQAAERLRRSSLGMVESIVEVPTPTRQAPMRMFLRIALDREDATMETAFLLWRCFYDAGRAVRHASARKEVSKRGRKDFLQFAARQVSRFEGGARMARYFLLWAVAQLRSRCAALEGALEQLAASSSSSMAVGAPSRCERCASTQEELRRLARELEECAAARMEREGDFAVASAAANRRLERAMALLKQRAFACALQRAAQYEENLLAFSFLAWCGDEQVLSSGFTLADTRLVPWVRRRRLMHATALASPENLPLVDGGTGGAGGQLPRSTLSTATPSGWRTCTPGTPRMSATAECGAGRNRRAHRVPVVPESACPANRAPRPRSTISGAVSVQSGSEVRCGTAPGGSRWQNQRPSVGAHEMPRAATALGGRTARPPSTLPSLGSSPAKAEA